jgi:purine-cytosine permease-like protein
MGTSLKLANISMIHGVASWTGNFWTHTDVITWGTNIIMEMPNWELVALIIIMLAIVVVWAFLGLKKRQDMRWRKSRH